MRIKNRKFVPIIQMFYEWQNESIYQVNYNKNIYCTVGEYFCYGKFTFFESLQNKVIFKTILNFSFVRPTSQSKICPS